MAPLQNQNRPVTSLRLAAGITQSELARRIGVTQSRIVHLERAEERGRPVQLDTVRRVAEACGVALVLCAEPLNSEPL